MRVIVLLCCFGTACSDGEPHAPDPVQNVAEPVRAVAITALEEKAKSVFDKRREEAQQAAAMTSSVAKAMEVYLFDPASAQYRQLRTGRGGAVCGKYNAKNRYGAYVGFKDFVLSKDKETLYFSSHNDGVRSEWYGSFAEAYVNACANEKERKFHAAMTAPVPSVQPLQDESDPFDDGE